MAQPQMLIGAPTVYYQRAAGQFRLTPTMDGVKFEEVFTKEGATLIVKVTRLGSNPHDLLPKVGEILDLTIFMPPDREGKQEIRTAKGAEVTYIKHSVSDTDAETWAYEFTTSLENYSKKMHIEGKDLLT